MDQLTHTEYYERYSNRLWNRIERANHFMACEAGHLKRVYEACPRHLFIPQFIESGLPRDFNPNREQDWQTAYADEPVLLFRSKEPEQVSTISQPSFVFYLLSILNLTPGDRVIEIGAGSGWNAALMASLVHPGQIYSFEIIEEMVYRARKVIERLKIRNTHIIHADAMTASKNFGPYSKGIFTASATDLPLWLHEQIEIGGLLFMVLRIGHHLDLGMLLEKKEFGFESRSLIPCAFVPVTGKWHSRHSDIPILIREKIESACIGEREQLYRMKVYVTPKNNRKIRAELPHYEGIESRFAFANLPSTT